MTARYLIIIVAMTVLAGCLKSARPMGVQMRTEKQFEVEVRRYQFLPPEKSMAIAGDPSGIYVSGYAYDYPTRDLAIREALEYCEQRREDRRIESECRTYAVSDEIREDLAQQGSDRPK